MLLLSTFFMVVGYTLLYSGIRAGPNQKYARAPWQLLVDAAKHVPGAAAQTLAGLPQSETNIPIPGTYPQQYYLNPNYAAQLQQFYGLPGTAGPTSAVGFAVPLPAAYAG